MIKVKVTVKVKVTMKVKVAVKVNVKVQGYWSYVVALVEAKGWIECQGHMKVRVKVNSHCTEYKKFVRKTA